MRRKYGLFGLALGLGALALASASSAEPVKIRISWAVAPAHLTPLISEVPKDIYRHWGKSYIVEPIRMRGSGPALQALAAGEIELGGLSAQALVLGVKRARLDLRVVAQLMSTGVHGYPTTSFYVRGSEITKIEDLKGKRLAVNARGSTIDAAVRAIAARYGWKDGADYQMVEVRFPAMLAALDSKRVDCAPLVQPFNLMADKKGVLKPLFSMGDALGPTQTLQYIARADWVAKHRAAVVDFLEDHLRFRRWIATPEGRKQAILATSRVTKIPPERFESWAFTKKAYYYAPDGKSETAVLQKNIDDLVKLHILPMSLDAAKYTDSSLTDDAARRLTM